MRGFLDTNVLLYLNSPNDTKCLITAKLLKNEGVISVQVLNDYCAVSRRKGSQSWDTISQRCDDLIQLLDVCDLTIDGQILARGYAARYGYTIYDANILASAKLAGCDSLWTEDMQHGQVIDGVEIVNPFL